MASDYGLNFGFRRSDESMAIHEGRYKTPATGSLILLGAAVEIDSAAAGRLKVAPNHAVPVSGFTGLLVQEESHLQGIFDTPGYGLGHDSIDLGFGKVDQLSDIRGGAGTKVWFRNTLAYARGTRSKDAVTIWTPTGVGVGDGLGWDGTKWVKEVVSGTLTPRWMVVTLIDTTVSGAEYCEAVLNF